jgi:TatD DNase family protein
MADDSNLWIDSHAHLTMFEPSEIEDVLARALEAGVGGVLVPATNADDLDRTVELASQQEGRIVAAVGVHPHDASSLDDGFKRRLRETVNGTGVVAVGEIGLDYHYMNSPREDQLTALEWQLDFASEIGLPVVLHNRESWSDLEVRLSARAGGLRGVCHSFTEGPEEVRRVVDLGLLVGVSGMVTFKQAHNIREMTAALDPASAMVETDSPFLAPVPHRGRRNEPAYVAHVGQRLAEEWDQRPEELARSTSANFRRLFGLGNGWPSSCS